MFSVEITDDAKAALKVQLREFGEPSACIVIFRQGPTGDVSRSKDGSTVWKIERPGNPWYFDIRSFKLPKTPEVQIIKGIRVCLAIIPHKDEKGVVIRLKDGKPTVEPLGT